LCISLFKGARFVCMEGLYWGLCKIGESGLVSPQIVYLQDLQYFQNSFYLLFMGYSYYILFFS